MQSNGSMLTFFKRVSFFHVSTPLKKALVDVPAWANKSYKPIGADFIINRECNKYFYL